MKNLKTKFASPDRSSSKEIKYHQEKIIKNVLFAEAVNLFPEIVFFLDKNRQVVFCNEALLKILGMKDSKTLVGKRPGEIFNCVNATKEEAGCGTSRCCEECGAIKTILNAQQGKNSIEECRMTIKTKLGEKALDLRVWAVPIDINDERFTMLTLKDIGDEKRRELLEKTFFHDILNEAGIITGYSQNVQDGLMEMDKETTSRIYHVANRMIETIQGQKDLLAAELGELKIVKSEFNIFEFLDNTVNGFIDSKWAKDKEIIIDMPEKGLTVNTDKVLLKRIIMNLIKNALEASASGDIVKVACNKADDKYIFSTNNSTVMPENIKLQIFQRTFSTKGQGRGIGTYSVKLFTEQYLKGKVSFISEKDKGTTFYIEI